MKKFVLFILVFASACMQEQDSQKKEVETRMEVSPDLVSNKVCPRCVLTQIIRDSLQAIPIQMWSNLKEMIENVKEEKGADTLAILFLRWTPDYTIRFSGDMTWVVQQDRLYMYPCSESYVLTYDMKNRSVHFLILKEADSFLSYADVYVKQHITYAIKKTPEFFHIWVPSSDGTSDCECEGPESRLRNEHPWLTGKKQKHGCSAYTWIHNLGFFVLS